MEVKDIMTRDVDTIDKEEPISKALSIMKDTGIKQMPVLDGKRYVGMLTYREIMRRGSIKTSSKCYNFSINTPRLSDNMDIYKAIELLKESGLNAIPVFNKDSLIGILSRTDIIKNIDRIIGNADSIKNFQIMNSDPVTIEINDTVDDAIDEIRGFDEYEIPVTEKKVLRGILRIEDAMNAIIQDKEKISYGEFTSGKSKVEVIVSSIMDNPVSVYEDDSIKKTCDVMIKNNLHVVPVVNDKNIVTGIIDISDILNAIQTGEQEGYFIEISGLNDYDDDLYDITYFMADRFLSNVSRIIGKSGRLLIHVRKYKTEGRGKYSIRSKLIAGRYHLNVDKADYNYGRGLKEIFETYEEMIKEK
ncbi:CBS domain-containing protein [Picrophilus oshimae]|uniref:CBS domain-containing protein n=1 Tax=Picrophilus torridus (strain ATCC 700027 / DSM 9790 / JCM 10055 / NBRC 100828 / KAW 2/3) TaxID=1122961 RepID=A0A8G2FVH7_PICTO|nr:CBS domain-containing protein [Picrophilus oshimae]SMD30247.1 CBS domain-containing protein [Picrophilus oshimae DSM 9789]